MAFDRRKFLASRQKPRHNNALEQRKPLVMLPILEDYVTTERDKQRVMLMAAKKSKSTLSGWNRTLTKLHKFLQKRNLNFLSMTEASLLDYVFELEDLRVSHSVVSGQQSAILFLLTALRLDDGLWSKEVILCYDAVLRRASCEKKRVRKGNVLELEALEKAVEVHILPFLACPEKINLPILRGAVTQVMQVNSLARLEDLRKLRATDLSRVTLDGVPAIRVCFRTMKNDPTYRGFQSHLIKTGGTLCPYRLLTLYYELLGLYFSDTAITDSNYLLMRTQTCGKGEDRLWLGQGAHAVSSNTILKDLNRCYHDLGFYTRVGAKSAKALGVSLAFESGLSDEQVRILGRWASITTARHYYDISERTLLRVGRQLTQATMKKSSPPPRHTVIPMSRQQTAAAVARNIPMDTREVLPSHFTYTTPTPLSKQGLHLRPTVIVAATKRGPTQPDVHVQWRQRSQPRGGVIVKNNSLAPAPISSRSLSCLHTVRRSTTQPTVVTSGCCKPLSMHHRVHVAAPLKTGAVIPKATGASRVITLTNPLFNSIMHFTKFRFT